MHNSRQSHIIFSDETMQSKCAWRTLKFPLKIKLWCRKNLHIAHFFSLLIDCLFNGPFTQDLVKVVRGRYVHWFIAGVICCWQDVWELKGNRLHTHRKRWQNFIKLPHNNNENNNNENNLGVFLMKPCKSINYTTKGSKLNWMTHLNEK